MHSISKIYRQVLAGIIANIATLSMGMAIGWSSPIVPKLQDELLKDTPLDRVVTTSEIGWIGSLVPIGGAISPIIAGAMAGKFGRKLAMLLSGVFLCIAFIILGVSESVGLIYAARFLHGLSVGQTMTVMPLYIGEIAQDSIRGALGTLMLLFMNGGIFLSYCIGPFVPYVTFQYICLVIPIAFIILFALMPESPTYWLLKGERTRAIESLKFLRNDTEKNILTELDVIQLAIEQTKTNAASSWKNLFSTRASRRAFIIACCLILVQQFSGINAVVYYSQSIFKRAGGDLAPEISTIIIGAVPVIVCFIAPYAIERFGRKTNLIVSGIGMAIASALLIMYFTLDNIDDAVDVVNSLSFLPIVSLILYLVFFNVGYGPIPFAMLAEIFTTDVKTYATIVVSTVSSVSAAIILQFFESLNEAVGAHWVFAIFAVCIVSGIVFTYFMVIETKGLTLMQIQEKFNSL